MTQPKLTANKGASEIRSKILRKMRELEPQDMSDGMRWEELRTYIKMMAKRASSRPGGLGKR